MFIYLPLNLCKYQDETMQNVCEYRKKKIYTFYFEYLWINLTADRQRKKYDYQFNTFS